MTQQGKEDIKKAIEQERIARKKATDTALATVLNQLDEIVKKINWINEILREAQR